MKALITGASSGIGKDMAKVLSQMGYELILVSTDKEKLEKVKSSLKTESKIIICDLRDEKKVFDLYEKTNKEFSVEEIEQVVFQ